MDIVQELMAPGAIAGAQPGAFAAQQLMDPASGGPAQQEMLAPVAGAAAGPHLVDGPELEAEFSADGSSQQVYNPEALRAKLESLPTVDRTLGEVEAAVRAACDAEGIVLCVEKSSRTHDGVSERFDMKKLICQRGGAYRQAAYERSLDAVPGRIRRQSRGSMKSGCPFEVTIRHAKSHTHPKVTNVKPDHNHVINRETVAVKLRLAGKLTKEQKDQVAKMTAQGMKPKEVTAALRALYPDRSVNHRAVQNAAAAHTRGTAGEFRRKGNMPPQLPETTAAADLDHTNISRRIGLTVAGMDIVQGLAVPGAIAGAQPGAFAAQQLMDPTSGGPPQQGMLATVAGAAAGPHLVDGPELEAESSADGSSQVYNPEALRAKLESLPTVDRTLGEVEAAVRAACDAEGIVLCVEKSSRTHDGVSERFDMKKLTCKRGGAYRQAAYDRSLDAVPGRTRRQSRGSMKSGCPFEVTIRHAKSHTHPKVTNVKPDHNHVINRETVAVNLRLAGKLTKAQKDQVAKMTAQGMKPKEVTTALRALHPDSSVNHRAVQNAAAAQSGPTLQDRRGLYADVSKRLGQAASILSDSLPPAIALALAESILVSVSSQAQAYNGVRWGEATFFPNSGGVRLPTRSSNLRKRGPTEAANSRAGNKRAASSGPA